jgi:hypothetical protein
MARKRIQKSKTLKKRGGGWLYNRYFNPDDDVIEIGEKFLATDEDLKKVKDILDNVKDKKKVYEYIYHEPKFNSFNSNTKLIIYENTPDKVDINLILEKHANDISNIGSKNDLSEDDIFLINFFINKAETNKIYKNELSARIIRKYPTFKNERLKDILVHYGFAGPDVEKRHQQEHDQSKQQPSQQPSQQPLQQPPQQSKASMSYPAQTSRSLEDLKTFGLKIKETGEQNAERAEKIRANIRPPPQILRSPMPPPQPLTPFQVPPPPFKFPPSPFQVPPPPPTPPSRSMPSKRDEQEVEEGGEDEEEDEEDEEGEEERVGGKSRKRQISRTLKTRKSNSKALRKRASRKRASRNRASRKRVSRKRASRKRMARK